MIEGSQHVTFSGCLQIAGTPYTRHARIYRIDGVVGGNIINFGHYIFRMDLVHFAFVFRICRQVLLNPFITFQLFP